MNIKNFFLNQVISVHVSYNLPVPVSVWHKIFVQRLSLIQLATEPKRLLGWSLPLGVL
jgi:hypothetical protein